MAKLSEILIVEREAQPYVGLPVHVSMNNWGMAMDRIPEVYTWLSDHNLTPAGPLTFRYHFIGDMDIPFRFELTVPTEERVDVGDDSEFIADEMPAGLYVSATHHGHPDSLLESILKVEAWTAEAGLTQATEEIDGELIYGGRFEMYRTDPEQQPDLGQWETEICNLLVTDDAAYAVLHGAPVGGDPVPAPASDRNA